LSVEPKSIGPTNAGKLNKNNMLEGVFSIAPMMDWTDCAEKTKHDQNLSLVAVGHAVPNAVLTIFK
jgi:hypothetical protein